ncbi:MAG TPA: TetR/AcrR family transcriptional regulator [Candidatus Sulfotelmatobacter sp.]|nr:TetR/AcrR family transcriptional regulator [Candidatus Sulfotelmatobacter sp.]
MAYEVTKTIAGRAYRYRVESVRDETSGKRRNRWTYLGRASPDPDGVARPRAPRGNARERLLDAFERLLADRDYEQVTADAIAAEAGLAHGTFYRHFRDKRDALRGALGRVREENRVSFDRLDDAVAGLAEARAQIRGLVDGLRKPLQHPGLLRATQVLALRDEVLIEERRAFQRAATRRLAEHLRALGARGLADVRDPDATAGVVLNLLQGMAREAIVEGVGPDEARLAAAADVLDRAVFPDPTRKIVTS